MKDNAILIVKGSPRRAGNTAVLAERLQEGAEAAGAEVHSFYLHGMDIAPCDACDGCRREPYDGCIVDDDMQILYRELEKASALVIASPVYWFTVSAQTKVFIDRCYGFFDGERNQLAGTRIGILMAYEDDDPFVSGAVNALRTFQDMFDYVGAPIVGMVYGQALDEGEIRKNPEVWTAAYELGRKLGRGSA